MSSSCFACILLLGLLVGLPDAAAYGTSTDAGTGSTAVPSLASRKTVVSLPGFRLGGRYDLDDPASYVNGGADGVTLESLGAEPLRTAYIAVGTPEYDDQGLIDNAVIVNSYYSGDASNMMMFWLEGQPGTSYSKGAVVGPGRLIDTNRFYVVFLDSLGLWGASKPSDGLGMAFPDYSYYDIVQANYRLLHDHLNVSRVRLATGVSMGAALTYVWGIMYPQYVDALLPIAGNVYPDNVAKWTFQLMTDALESDPLWRETGGDYYDVPAEKRTGQGLMFAWSILEQTSLDLNYRALQPWSEVQKDVFYWEPTGDQGLNLRSRARDFDINDMLVRNRSALAFDVRAELHRIQAPTLALHATNDQWVIYSKVAETIAQIPGAELADFESPLAHYACFRAPNLKRSEVLRFLRKNDLAPGLAGPGRPAGSPGIGLPSDVPF